MAHSPKLPDERNGEGPDAQMSDPKTAKSVQYADLRSEFESMSRKVPRNAEAERAFILSKIEIIRSDPHLSEDEKKRAIADLQDSLH